MQYHNPNFRPVKPQRQKKAMAEMTALIIQTGTYYQGKVRKICNEVKNAIENFKLIFSVYTKRVANANTLLLRFQ